MSGSGAEISGLADVGYGRRERRDAKISSSRWQTT